MSKRRCLVLAVLLVLGGARAGSAGQANKSMLPPTVDYLSPEDEQKTFLIKDGYKLQLVLSDPIIRDPVLTVFDGNGRMFVAEMRTYMQDIDGNNQHTKKGRVSVHWSSKHDGVYDKHAIFVDDLVLPRMVLPLDHGVIINETDSDDYWLYTDTKGDGVADQKILLSKGGGRGGNLEHQPGGLIWDLDNWLYIAVDSMRMRIHGTDAVREPIPNNSGQWGLAQDDYGKPYFVNAGYEVGPLNFEVPILYGACNAIEDMGPDWQVVWPAVGLADVQGGPNRFRPADKTLNHVTACCGPDIYRGDRLPADLRGDLLFCEPVGRLIRRAKVETKDGFTYLKNAYPKSEFIRSTDPNFRPVNLAETPEGDIFVTDMYRGIIQERDWVNQGSYLRGVVQKYGLEKNFGRGRIWRLVHDPFKADPQPHMLNETPAQIVEHLGSMNGWTRDTAQKLLVLRDDKSVAPALMAVARASTNHLARIHAIWTLEGIDELKPDFILEKLKDPNPQVRIAAIRASETLYLKGDHSLVKAISALNKDADPSVVLQVLLTASRLKWFGWNDLLNSTLAANPPSGVKKIMDHLVPPNSPVNVAGNSSGRPNPPAEPERPPYNEEEKKLLSRGGDIYNQLCFACHAPNGKGTPYQGAAPGTTLAPALSGSRIVTGSKDEVISIVLKGLTGQVEGKSYDAQMIPMESNDDAWIASVISYIRQNFGNDATFVTAEEVANVRQAIKSHSDVWTITELNATLPQPMTNRSLWKLTSSDNSRRLSAAIDGNLSSGYDTGRPQTPGMWVQIELPEATEITGVELDAGKSIEDYPRGYKVQLSTNENIWGAPIVAGHSIAARDQIMFPPTVARYIRILQTGSDPRHVWSIHELQVLRYLTPEELLRPPDLFSTGEGSPAPAAAPTLLKLPPPLPPPVTGPFGIK